MNQATPSNPPSAQREIISIKTDDGVKVQASLFSDSLLLSFRSKDGRANVLALTHESTIALRELLSPGHADLLAALVEERNALADAAKSVLAGRAAAKAGRGRT